MLKQGDILFLLLECWQWFRYLMFIVVFSQFACKIFINSWEDIEVCTCLLSHYKEVRILQSVNTKLLKYFPLFLEELNIHLPIMWLHLGAQITLDLP